MRTVPCKPNTIYYYSILFILLDYNGNTSTGFNLSKPINLIAPNMGT